MIRRPASAQGHLQISVVEFRVLPRLFTSPLRGGRNSRAHFARANFGWGLRRRVRNPGRSGMLRAVDLHNDLRAVAIHEVTADRCLAAKMQAFGFEEPQAEPEESLGFRRMGAQISRSFIWHDPQPKFARAICAREFRPPRKGEMNAASQPRILEEARECVGALEQVPGEKNGRAHAC